MISSDAHPHSSSHDSRSEPQKAFNFCFDDEILRQYFEFDKKYTQYLDGTANEHDKTVMENCLMFGPRIKPVPMALLVQLGSIVDFNIPMIETVFEKINQPYKYEDFKERLDRTVRNLIRDDYRPQVPVLVKEYGIKQKTYSIPEEVWKQWE